MPVITGAMQYPKNALDELRALGIDVCEMDALTPALEAGSAKATNIVLMGRLSKYLPIEEQKWLDAIAQTVAPRFVEMNVKAFSLGRGE